MAANDGRLVIRTIVTSPLSEGDLYQVPDRSRSRMSPLASSNISRRGRLAIARAIATRCRKPTGKVLAHRDLDLAEHRLGALQLLQRALLGLERRTR